MDLPAQAVDPATLTQTNEQTKNKMIMKKGYMNYSKVEQTTVGNQDAWLQILGALMTSIFIYSVRLEQAGEGFLSPHLEV